MEPGGEGGVEEPGGTRSFRPSARTPPCLNLRSVQGTDQASAWYEYQGFLGTNTKAVNPPGFKSLEESSTYLRRDPGIPRACRARPRLREHTQQRGNTMAGEIPKDFRRVVVAAAVGNVIEWYDFYIFGSLASILSVKFFDKTHPVAALLSTIALFTAGFLIRPLGASLFGWLGDRVGRKYTFLVTLSGMGLATAAIGLIPTFASIGVSAAFILFGLRMVQGLCLGGEYGGAITYVAEHVPDERRGYYTGWLQTSPTLGIVVSMAVIVGARTRLGPQEFPPSPRGRPIPVSPPPGRLASFLHPCRC